MFGFFFGFLGKPSRVTLRHGRGHGCCSWPRESLHNARREAKVLMQMAKYANDSNAARVAS